jgi:hypothetical protein
VSTPWAKAAARSPPPENDSTIELSRMKSVGAPMLGGVEADSGTFVAGLNTDVAQPASIASTRRRNESFVSDEIIDVPARRPVDGAAA